MSRSLTGLLIGLAAVSFFPGCGGGNPKDKDKDKKPAAKKDHDDHDDAELTKAEVEQLRKDTETWPGTIAQLRKHRDTIEKEMGSNDHEKLHHALAYVEKILTWLPTIAKDTSIPKASWESIGSSVQQLHDTYDEMHHALDEGEKFDYAKAKSKIDKAIETLATMQPAAKKVEKKEAKEK